jgi:hypothetical protein
MSIKVVVNNFALEIEVVWKLRFFISPQTNASGHHTITTMLYGLFSTKWLVGGIIDPKIPQMM